MRITPYVRSSLLALFMLFARFAWTHGIDYGFLIWNLVLAWVPLGAATIVRATHRRAPSLGALAFVVWLAFLPNAPYLVTDFIHLRWRDGAPLWFDALMLATFAWTGVSLGVVSLRIIVSVVCERAGTPTAIAFVAATSFLTGFGIYLGRFIRLNSWDVIFRPLAVLGTIARPVAHPIANIHVWIASTMFAAFFLVVFGMNGSLRKFVVLGPH